MTIGFKRKDTSLNKISFEFFIIRSQNLVFDETSAGRFCRDK
jgi:hypothetical protein